MAGGLINGILHPDSNWELIAQQLHARAQQPKIHHLLTAHSTTASMLQIKI